MPLGIGLAGARMGLGLAQGAKPAGPAYLTFCTFGDADTTALTAYSWANANDVRPGIAQWEAVAGPIRCTGGKAASSTDGLAYAYLNCGVADGTLGLAVTISVAGSSHPRGLMFRYKNDGNHWVAGFNTTGNLWGIWEIVAYAITPRATAAYTVTLGTTFAVVVTLAGNSITATRDGGASVSHSSASLAGYTNHGIRSRFLADRFDDFSLL